MKQIKNNYKLLNTITMKLKYIMPMLATVVLIVPYDQRESQT